MQCIGQTIRYIWYGHRGTECLRLWGSLIDWLIVCHTWAGDSERPWHSGLDWRWQPAEWRNSRLQTVPCIHWARQAWSTASWLHHGQQAQLTRPTHQLQLNTGVCPETSWHQLFFTEPRSAAIRTRLTQTSQPPTLATMRQIFCFTLAEC